MTIGMYLFVRTMGQYTPLEVRVAFVYLPDTVPSEECIAQQGVRHNDSDAIFLQANDKETQYIS